MPLNALSNNFLGTLTWFDRETIRGLQTFVESSMIHGLIRLVISQMWDQTTTIWQKVVDDDCGYLH